MDREAWRAAIHGVTKSQTQLSNWSELKQFSDLPKWIAPGHQHQRPRHRPLSVARSPTLLPAKGSFCPEVPSGLQVTFTCYWTFYQNTCSVSFCFTSFAQCYVYEVRSCFAICNSLSFLILLLCFILWKGHIYLSISLLMDIWVFFPQFLVIMKSRALSILTYVF